MTDMMHKTRPEQKPKGVLLPVFSLPSKYGTGCFSREAREFIDWLRETGHTYWQILPLNPTGVADSPYQPLSSFAGNAHFIDPVQLVETGLLTEEEIAGLAFGDDPARIDYETLYDSRLAMLKLAYRRFTERCRVEDVTSGAGEIGAGEIGAGEIGADEARRYAAFAKENAFWLDDYAMFMALRERFGRELSWDDWPDELRLRDKAALERAAKDSDLAETIGFHRWTQYEFYRQWDDLKSYANKAGVRIIGDMPVYVSYDSTDCWADPGQFQLDQDLQPVMIAGVPPDGFSDEGQLWGNPLYDWEKMKADGYAWWISRIRQSFRLYDVIRLDHFRGYEAYYSCSADAENAMHGIWRKGPGMDLFRKLEEVMDGDGSKRGAIPLRMRFIAEDLGFLTEDVYQLLRDTGFPGTRVLQFAFDGDPENLYLPENFHENCVVYTGTHDNDTTVGWFRSLSGDAQAGILQYLGLPGIEAWKLVLEYDAFRKAQEMESSGVDAQRADALGADVKEADVKEAEVAGAENHPVSSAASDAPPDPAILAAELLVSKALDSKAKLAIIPLQDYLLLGSEARVNVPGTVGENWRWRVTDRALHG